VIRGPVPALILVVLLGGVAVGGCARPGEPPPPAGLRQPIGEFGNVLARQLDYPAGTEVRFVGFEQRAHDQLLFLFFELRQWPQMGPATLAYLVSRSTATAELEPSGMGGGIVLDGDLATDSELEHLRNGPQPPCPVARP
jgi:hypothetical protein